MEVGIGLTATIPGVERDQMLDWARRADELAGRGVDVSDIQDFPWGRFVFFKDPDGNRWAVQEVPQRG